MSDDEPKDESTDDSEQQSNEQTAESDQPAEQSEEQPADTDQAVDQSEEQPTDSDQSAEQSEEQRADGDQPAEQSEGEVAEGDQPAEHPEEQPPESDQSETSASADNTLAFAGGPASPAGGAGSGSATQLGTKDIQVIAEFTMEGKQFIGDIKIFLFEYDKKGMSSQVWAQGDWQTPTKKGILIREGNVITTPLVRFTTSWLAITANARIILSETYYQMMSEEFVFPMPSGDTLRTKFDLGVGKVDETVTAPTPDVAKGKVSQLPQFKGRFVDLVAQPIGNQQFRVTGRYATGTISSADGRRL